MFRSDRTINYQVRIYGYINRIELCYIYIYIYIKSTMMVIIYIIYNTNINSLVMRVCIFLSGLYYSAQNLAHRRVGQIFIYLLCFYRQIDIPAGMRVLYVNIFI
jgi:hypothetical protein